MNYKRIIALVVAFTMLLSLSAVFAKSETVYFMLDRHGKLTKTIVVNSFEGSNQDIIDYGVYEKIENLSSSAKPTVEGEKIVFKSEGDDSIFYYRGEMEHAEIPWNIEIKYYLDGKEVNPEILVESKGNFEMRISVNSPKSNRFNDRYTVQMQGTLLGGISEISAENASMVAIGSQYTVASLFIPGQEHAVVIRGKIDGLEIGAFTFTGVRAVLDVDFDFKAIGGQISDLANASAQVLAGIVRLENGANTLKSGVQRFTEGIVALDGQSAALVHANTAISGAIWELAQGSASLPEGTKLLLGSLAEFQGKLIVLKDAAMQMTAAPDPAIASFANAILGQLEFNQAMIEALEKINQGELAISQGLSGLNSNYSAFSEGQSRYVGGVGMLAEQGNSLIYGADAFSGGFAELIDGQKAFVAGIGAAELKFKEAISFLDRSGKANPGSFVHPKNKTENVTFVMRTEELRKPVPVREPLPPVPKKSMLEKLMNLFGME